MNPIKAIIVDDEPNARKALRGMLNEHFEEVLVLADCGNVPEAVKMINRFKPNLIFLDIDMPGYSGFELLDFFDEQQIWFNIIFVTAYSEYSLKAFESSAVDYILKPVRLEHMKRALRKINFNVPSPIQYKVLRENFNLQNERKVVLQTSETIYVVNQDDIIFIQAEGSYTKIVTVSHGVLTITKKLAEFEYLETDAPFFRAHRSYLVNLNHIKRIDKRDFLLVMSNEAQVQLAQDKKALLIERFTA